MIKIITHFGFNSSVKLNCSKTVGCQAAKTTHFCSKVVSLVCAELFHSSWVNYMS